MKKLEKAILPNTPLRGICSPLMILERDLRGDGSHRMELSAALFMEVTEGRVLFSLNASVVGD